MNEPCSAPEEGATGLRARQAVEGAPSSCPGPDAEKKVCVHSWANPVLNEGAGSGETGTAFCAYRDRETSTEGGDKRKGGKPVPKPKPTDPCSIRGPIRAGVARRMVMCPLEAGA